MFKLNRIEMRKISLIVLLGASLGLSVKAQRIDLAKIGPATKVNASGIVYALPKTNVIVEVEVKKVETKAPAANICDAACQRRTGLKPLPNKEIYTIENYTISSVAKVDEDQVYLVNPRNKWNKKKDISFTLSGLGIIQGADVAVEDKTFEIVTTAISSVISVAGIFSANVKAAALPAGTKAADSRLMYLLQRRDLLISSGNYGADLSTLQFQLTELNKLIAAEVQGLQGETIIKTAKLRFEILLDAGALAQLRSDQAVQLEILKLDENKGVSINPRILAMNEQTLYPKAFTQATSGKSLKLSIRRKPSTLNATVSGLIKPTGKRGLAYRIPEHVLVSLSSENEPKLKSLIPMAQLGKIIYLPYKMDKANVSYYESLGSLKSVTVSSSAVSGASIETGKSILSDAKSLIDGKSTIEKLQKEVDELELKVRKKAAEGQLNNSSNNDED